MGSMLSAGSIDVSGKNIAVMGSNVVADQDISLRAQENITVGTAQQSESESHLFEQKKSGLMSTGGIGVTVGSSSTKMTDSGQSISSVGSTVGSVLGNVSMTAGEDLRVQGAEVLAGKDINLTGKNVSILAAENQLTQSHTVEQKQSGLTLALSGAVGSAVNTAVTTAKAASEESSGRLGALQGVKAALNGVQAVQAGQLVQAEGGDAASMFGISASLGSQKSSSEQHQEQTHVTGSTLTAGNNLTINATGEGNAANSGDIVVQGSQLQAGGDTTLDAARDVLLLGAANTQKTDGSNSSSGGSVGVSLGISGASSGLSIFANANKGQGSEHGDGTSWTETTLDSGGTLSLYSGRDTSLVGAQVSGETVKVEVGRDLLLQSQQDSDNYDAKQQSSSVGGSFSPGSMTGSISINGSQDKLNSNFDSVQEQTGIFAGSGGFDITVGGHTQLDGAVIGSTVTADKNTLDTGTLGFSDIDNQADFKVEHQSVGISTGGNIGSQFVGNMANGLLVGANNEGHADSTTHAAVSEGTITVRDTDNQQQNVDDLSRDVEQANNALSPIFDKEKEQNRLKEAQLIGEIGSQVGDVFRTQGQIIATQAANEKMQGVSEADREAAKANWEKANPGQVATAEDINGQVYKTAYDQAFNASGYGTGGKFQQTVQAATAALQGLAGGDIAKAIAGGSAPYLAEVIKQSTGDNEEARLAAHAVVGSVLAHLQGNSAVAGGAGALTGEIAADLIMQQLYPGKMVSELSETEKQTISALSTLAAGLAGGLTGDSSADAVAGAQAGKNAVENNALGLALKGCGIAAPCRSLIAKQVLEIGVKAGITGIVAKEIADKISEDDLDHLVTLKMMGNDEITEKYLNSLQDKYAPAHTGGDQNAGSGPTDTGGNQIADNSPDHTGNDQSTGQGATNTGNTDGKPDAGGNVLVNPGADPLTKKDIVYLSENPNGKIDTVINETLSGKKNFTSSTTLTSDEALAAGLKFLGTGYKEIGKSGSGVYHSADGTKEFRIDSGSIDGAHAPGVPHVHFGVKNPETGKYISNNHVPYKD
ncbi:hypothetical protein HPC53_10620 [Yersinia pestis]|nr:hypothetical protein [Yersinia pestis]